MKMRKLQDGLRKPNELEISKWRGCEGKAFEGGGRGLKEVGGIKSVRKKCGLRVA